MVKSFEELSNNSIISKAFFMGIFRSIELISLDLGSDKITEKGRSDGSRYDQ